MLPEEILQIRLDDFDPSPQGVEQQEIEDECSYGDRDWTTGGNEGNCYGVAHECGLPVLTRTLVTGFMPCAILVLLLDSTTRKASGMRATLVANVEFSIWISDRTVPRTQWYIKNSCGKSKVLRNSLIADWLGMCCFNVY